MKTYALDTNCFIDAVTPASSSWSALQQIFRADAMRKISLKVSLQTLHELEEKKGKAFELANSLPKLQHWPIGSWDEQVGTWKEQVGTWNDAKRNDEIQSLVRALAKSGTSIRDRGAYLDALCNKLDGFVTSDKQLVGSGPSSRINSKFPTKVVTPEELVSLLDQ
jgi:hypothetical protein